MALSTYSDLQAAIASWLARDDLTATIPDFITLFESSANKRLRVRQMQTTATLTPSSGSASLPSDYLAWRRVTYNGAGGGQLEYVEPDWLRAAYPSGESGTAKFFTIEGSNLIVGPQDDTTLTLLYYQKITALSSGANWLFTAHPDLYLFGSLCEAQMFTDDMERAAMWKSRRDETYQDIERLSMKSQGGGAVRPIGTIV
jgi:hypothetical protein